MNDVKPKVTPPAVALMILGIVGLLGIAVSIVLEATGGKERLAEWLQEQEGEPNEELRRLLETSAGVFGVAMYLMQIGVCIFIIYAARQMMQLRQWSAALVASIVVMVPCVTWCCICIPGIGVGIWSLVVLLDADVKRAFSGVHVADERADLEM